MTISIKTLMSNSQILKTKILYLQANLCVWNQSKSKSNQAELESKGKTHPQTQKSQAHIEKTMSKDQSLFWFLLVFKV